MKLSDTSLCRLATLYTVERKFLCDIAGIDVAESENERLKLRFKAVTAEYLNISLEQQKEIEMREANNFDLRMQLEKIFRYAIKKQNDVHVTESVIFLRTHHFLTLTDF